MSRGRGRKTAVFEMQAAIISSTVDAVRFDRKMGRAYVDLLKMGGPGFLLRIGSHTSTIWERRLSRGDINLILEFLREHASDIFAKCTALNAIAARNLLEGFVAYGWSRAEILASTGQLINTLKEYWQLQDSISEPELTVPTALCVTPSISPASEIRESANHEHIDTTPAMDIDHGKSDASGMDVDFPAPAQLSHAICDDPSSTAASGPSVSHNSPEWWNQLCNFQGLETPTTNSQAALWTSWSHVNQWLEVNSTAQPDEHCVAGTKSLPLNKTSDITMSCTTTERERHDYFDPRYGGYVELDSHMTFMGAGTPSLETPGLVSFGIVVNN